MIVDDSSRCSAVTSCGKIKTNYAYNGTYGFIFQFGGASLYIYDSKRGEKHVYKIFSRSWYPEHSGKSVLDIDFNKGFLLFKSSKFFETVATFQSFCFLMLKDFNGEEFSSLNLNYTSQELFKSELL